jgi:transketolase
MNYDYSQIAKSVRRDILTMSYEAQSAHAGGAYSVVEILVALYFGVMKINPKKPNDSKRDRLVFSKAHDAKALYATLAARGFFPKKYLARYEVNNAILPGHSTRHCVPGVEVSAGALGHGLSMAAGMALGIKQHRAHAKVFAVLSDGECDEGSTWEAALFASHHMLDNLVAVVDYNKLQGYGYVKDVLDLEPFTAKWQAFGWSVKEADGHDTEGLIRLLKRTPFAKGKPSIVVAHTIKGFGGPKRHINQISSQYKPPTEEEYKETREALI